VKNKPLGITNMTQGHPFKWGWVHFRSFKVAFNQNIARRSLETLKREK